MSGLERMRELIEDECIATDSDVELLRRLLAIYEAVTPLVDPTHAVPQWEWNGVMARLRFAVAEFEGGGGTNIRCPHCDAPLRLGAGHACGGTGQEQQP